MNTDPRDAEIASLRASLAQIYRLCGDDPAGASDYELAGHAIDAVEHLKQRTEAALAEIHGHDGLLDDVYYLGLAGHVSAEQIQKASEARKAGSHD